MNTEINIGSWTEDAMYKVESNERNEMTPKSSDSLRK